MLKAAIDLNRIGTKLHRTLEGGKALPGIKVTYGPLPRLLCC